MEYEDQISRSLIIIYQHRGNNPRGTAAEPPGVVMEWPFVSFECL